MRRSLIIVLALCALVPLAHAQVYRWVDGRGTVHFSQMPPPPGVKYTVLNVATDTATAPAAPGSPAAPAAARAGATAARAPVANTPANRARLCQQLQQNLALLNSSQALNVAGPDGKPVALSEPQRAVQKATTQAQLKQYCQTAP